MSLETINFSLEPNNQPDSSNIISWNRIVWLEFIQEADIRLLRGFLLSVCLGIVNRHMMWIFWLANFRPGVREIQFKFTSGFVLKQKCIYLHH